MFARKIRVECEGKLCPIKWLDSFAMRSFTGSAEFDDTLPTADGQMEIGYRVPIDKLRVAMEDWFKRKGYVAWQSSLSIVETVSGCLETSTKP